jgi:hypothetical protein
MSTRNLNGRKYKLEIPTDFTLENYTARDILRNYKQDVAYTNAAENLYYSIIFFLPKLKLLEKSCSTWKPYQEMLNFLDDKIIEIFPENKRQTVQDSYKDTDILSRIELKLDLHRNSNINLKEIEAARFANFLLIKNFNQLMDAIETNQQNMTTTKRQRDNENKLESFFLGTAPILRHGYHTAATSNQPGSSATKPMNTDTNFVVGDVITTKKPCYSETITAIQANGQSLELNFLETFAANDILFEEWLEKEAQKKLLPLDPPNQTLRQKVCYLCSVQTPGI